MTKENEDLYHFIISELEFQSKSVKLYAVLYGFLGGILFCATCAMILASCTMFRNPPSFEPRPAVFTPSEVETQEGIIITMAHPRSMPSTYR